MDSFAVFLRIGFDHIVQGYDHLLFLLALVIGTSKPRSLLAVISAFTVAHSTTLILCALDVLSLDRTFVEAAIALSIAYVAVENVATPRDRGRWIVAGAFGLIHGAGFSGDLVGILRASLDSGNLWPSLIGFNVGIEAGQFMVLLLAVPLAWWLRRSESGRRVLPEVSRVIAAIGGVLFIDRLFHPFAQ